MIFFQLVSYSFKLTGYNLADVEGLLLINQKTGLKIHGLLYSQVLVSTLGAVTDMSVSVSSPLVEIKAINPTRTVKELFSSGMNIGKDLIGTMVNTLVFAFLGSSLVTILILISYGIDTYQLLNSDFFAVEIVTSLVATSVIVAIVPITSYLSAMILNLKGEKK